MFRCISRFIGFYAIREIFGGCVRRGIICLNSDRDGVKELVNLELDERVLDRYTGEVRISCLLEVFLMSSSAR